VWKAYTEPEHLTHWWGPKGFTVRAATVDLRPGGAFHYCLQAPDGHETWGKWIYREIVAPERFVAIASFSDKTGGVTLHPMSETWPLEMLTTLTLSEDRGRTTVTIRAVPHSATESERETFAEGHDAMRQGFAGTLDQLAGYLAKLGPITWPRRGNPPINSSS